MIRLLLKWLGRVQEHDIEGTALSFVVCQITLAVVASAHAWVVANNASILLFLPTVLLSGFFLRFVDGLPVLLTAFIATWYFIVPPPSSFALNASGAADLGFFVISSGLIIVGAAAIRRLLKERHRALPGKAATGLQRTENRQHGSDTTQPTRALMGKRTPQVLGPTS